MKRILVGCAMLAMLGSSAWAGVVIEMEVTSSGGSGSGELETLYAQGDMARMDTHPPRGGEKMSIIFRDQTMWIVNRGKKECQKIDKEGMEALGDQLGSAMKQLEALPPEQREMMQKMMKGKMPGMGEAAERRLEAGGSDKVGSYACTMHTAWSGDRKVWEVCLADKSAAAEMEEAMGAFQAMSRFTEDLQAALRQGPFAGMIDNPYNKLDELEGFPVRVRTFDRSGKMEHETVMKSITRKDVGAATFSIPEGYEVKDMKEQMARGR
jgi:outer membrane lipoprotein-sorting protein